MNWYLKKKTKKILVAVAEVYGQHGTASNFSFFEKIFYDNKFQGFDELNVIGALLNFCFNTNSKVIEKSYTIFDFLKREGNSMTKMYFGQIATYMSNIIMSKIEKENENMEQTSDAKEKQEIGAEIAELERLLTVYDQLIQE